MPTTLTLGRDPAADIIIGDPSISRRHAELVLLDDRRIFIRDLGGPNGSARIRDGARTKIEREIVAPGDQVAFGDIVLSFDDIKQMMLTKLGRQPIEPTPAPSPTPSPAPTPFPGPSPAPTPSPSPSPSHNTAGIGEFVPVLGGGLARLRERGLLWPALAFALLVSRLSWLLSQKGDSEALASFVTEFSVALVIVGFIVVYRLCGKIKPWTVIAGVMAAEVVIMACHPIFDPPFCIATGAAPILAKVMPSGDDGDKQPKPKGPGAQPPRDDRGQPSRDVPQLGPKRVDAAVQPDPAAKPDDYPGFFSRLWAFFCCAGLREELEKMLPVFGLIFLARRSTNSDVKRWGVFEPLDAIVYACAAASAFIVIETFGVHGYVGKVFVEARNKDLLNVAAPLMFPLAVLRTIDALTGHLAYSGYFAYFVGLGLLRPAQRERLWIGGWLVAALIHGFFDSVADEGGLLAPTLATFVGFFFLITAIVNARKISPTREENFATRAFSRLRRDAAAD